MTHVHLPYLHGILCNIHTHIFPYIHTLIRTPTHIYILYKVFSLKGMMCFPLFLKLRNLFILQPGLGYVILVAYRAPEHVRLNESLSSVTQALNWVTCSHYLATSLQLPSGQWLHLCRLPELLRVMVNLRVFVLRVRRNHR